MTTLDLTFSTCVSRRTKSNFWQLCVGFSLSTINHLQLTLKEIPTSLFSVVKYVSLSLTRSPRELKKTIGVNKHKQKVGGPLLMREEQLCMH